MTENIIKLISNEGGDWETLKLNGKTYFEGHSIPNHIWLEIIHILGAKVETEVSDEDNNY